MSAKTERGHQHVEAFCVMTYHCEDCGQREEIWNSRDGVTPFMAGPCRRLHSARTSPCGGSMQHIAWERDMYEPNYQPKAGERVWRDGTLDMMRDIMRRRVESAPEYIPEGRDVEE